MAEITARLIWKDPLPTEKTYADNYFFVDSFGILKAHPNGRYHSTARSKKTGAIIYDVTYSVDSYSRRITPASNPELRNKHLLFFGCSFTYGEGLEDDQTIPAQVAMRAQHYMPYNYAFHGHSPSEMLAKMGSKTLKNEIKEKEGTLIYIFFDSHIQRVIGSMRIAASWGKNCPYYYLGPHNEVLRNGNVTTGRLVLSHIYWLLTKSELLKFLKIDFPPRLTDKHIHLTARIIEESYRHYKEQFPAGDFYVVIYPGSEYGTRLVKELSNAGIKTLDYSKIFNPGQSQYVLSPEDLHPSAKADEEVAEHLVRDLHL